MCACDHEHGAGSSLQHRSRLADPVALSGGEGDGGGPEPAGGRQGLGQLADAAMARHQPVLGHDAGLGRRGFGDQQAAAPFASLERQPRLGPVASPSGLVRARAEDIGVQAYDGLGLIQLQPHRQRPAEGDPRGLQHAVLVHGLEHVPPRPGPAVGQRLEFAREGRRGTRAGQNAQPLALGLVEPPGVLHHRRFERLPARGPAFVAHRLRAVRIVEAQHLGLGVGVRGSAAQGMGGQALELGRPAVIGLADHRLGVAAERHRRGVEARLARNQVLGRLDIGNGARVRLAFAGGKAADGQGRPHDLEQAPAPGVVQAFEGGRMFSRPRHRWHRLQSVMRTGSR